MHIQINKQQKDPNFPSLVLWLKSRLGNQQTPQELLSILSYAFIFKTKHKSIIIISERYKIMIKWPEVYLGIATCRSWAQKSIYIFLQKSFSQIRLTYKINHIKRST
jgi:hypothetical protein